MLPVLCRLELLIEELMARGAAQGLDTFDYLFCLPSCEQHLQRLAEEGFPCGAAAATPRLASSPLLLLTGQHGQLQGCSAHVLIVKALLGPSIRVGRLHACRQRWQQPSIKHC